MHQTIRFVCEHNLLYFVTEFVRGLICNNYNCVVLHSNIISNYCNQGSSSKAHTNHNNVKFILRICIRGKAGVYNLYDLLAAERQIRIKKNCLIQLSFYIILFL